MALGCGRGAALAVVAGPGPGSRVEFENLGDGQFRAEAGWDASFPPPVRTFTALAWVVACRSVAEAYEYRFLKDVKELP